MSTTKLYQSDVYIKEWTTVICDVAADLNGKPALHLKETAFFPEGGGQSCDLGTISVTLSGYSEPLLIDVIDVQEDGDDVIHAIALAGKYSQAETDEILAALPGASVSCALDWDRRFDNMQRHCGEHILSGIFYQECGGVNRGFHMGDDYMTIDISLEDEPTNPEATKPSEITHELAQRCELLANRVIWSNAPVTVMRFGSREEIENLPLRKALAFDEDISIVCVGSVENAADCVACCGTHPSTAGQVGLLKIYKVENYKGMFRVYFEAGQRALEDYVLKHEILTSLSNRYSSSVEDFPGKIRAQEDKLAAAKNELFHIKKALMQIECTNLDALLADKPGVALYQLKDFSMDDAFNMAKEYMGTERCGGNLILLYSMPATSYVLVSDGSINCGSLVKEYASFYNGKGGGSAVSARAIFTNDEDAALFADLIKKLLR